MRVGIDARAATEDRGGRGRVVRELIAALAASDAPGPFVLVARERWAGAALDERFGWVLHGRPDPLWHLAAARTANRRCDAFVSTNSYLTAWFLRVPAAVFVMDLVAYRPELMPQRRARRIELATLPLAVRRARALLCISQATADDLVARFPAAAGRTRVVPLAADARFAPGDPPAPELLARHGLDGPYVLGVGTLEPRKNLPRLIEAFAALPDEVRAGRRLALVGALGWDTGATTGAIRRHGALVRVLGHVPDADLGALYRGADLFAYPSLYEGFGLPVLEAMARGVPVATSDRSATAEVAGSAALLFDPDDARAMRAAIERLLAGGPAVEALRARGRERVRRYTWERTAELTLASYRRAL